jgi:hypothetical protein
MDIIASYKKYTGKMKDKNKKTKIDYKKQGKRNKAMGADFERRTRKDLEDKGWKVSKYSNNVDLMFQISKPAKPGRFRMMQTGFPDFIAYKLRFNNDIISGYEIQFVECKTNGYLSKEEKEKARWYLDNKYCNKFFIAYKTKEKNRVKVNYKELE